MLRFTATRLTTTRAHRHPQSLKKISSTLNSILPLQHFHACPTTRHFSFTKFHFSAPDLNGAKNTTTEQLREESSSTDEKANAQAQAQESPSSTQQTTENYSPTATNESTTTTTDNSSNNNNNTNAQQQEQQQEQQQDGVYSTTFAVNGQTDTATKVSYKFKDPVTANFYKQAEQNMAQREQYVDMDDPENKPLPHWVAKVYTRFALIAFLFFATGLIANYFGIGVSTRESDRLEEEKLRGAMLRRAVALDKESNELMEGIKKDRDQLLSKYKIGSTDESTPQQE